MTLDPSFDVPCQNPACGANVPVTRTELRAGSMTCAACGATTAFTGDGAREIEEVLARLEAALRGLGFDG